MQKKQFNKIRFNNFKPFGEKMQTFNEKPITLIYGPNSIGKSSLIHFMAYRNEIQIKKNFNIIDIYTGDTISLGGFINFVHKKDKDKNITLNYNVNAFKKNKVELLLNIGIDRENVDIKKITYMIDDNLFVEINNTLIYVNIEHDIIKNWISQIEKNGNWNKKDIDTIINKIISLQYDISENEDTVKDYLLDVYQGDNWTETDEKYKSMNILKKKFLSWEKKDEDLKLTIDDLIKIDADKENNKFSSLFSNFSVYDNYLLNKNNILSLNNILIHMAIDSIIRINTEFWNQKASFTYIGPLRFYPERHSFLQEQKGIEINSSEAFWGKLKENKNLITNLNIFLKKLSIPYSIKVNRLYTLNYLFNENKVTISKDELEEVASYVEELIFVDNRSNTPVHNREIGLGITQLLPILGNSLVSENMTIAIEQPELHLHPKLQSELADIFILMNKQRRNKYLIETHSEHLLLRIMKRMRHTAEDREGRDKTLDLTPDDVCLIYVDSDGENTFINELELDEDGSLLDPWPNGFFEEGHRERFD